MSKFQGSVAVVTGAASGIGRAIAQGLAGKGCHLALVDINERGLGETAALISGHGRPVTLYTTDVSDKTQMEKLPDAILRDHQKVNLLVNNAGVAIAGPFETCSLEDFEWIVGVNFWGMIYGCKYFLPQLKKAECSHIVNIASDFALIGLPTKTGYCATKFAMRGFSEALRSELYGTNVGLTCVYPGPVDTGIIRNSRVADERKRDLEARFVSERGIAPEKIADKVIRGIDRNAARVLIGKETYLIDIMTRLFPALTNEMVSRIQKRIPFL